MKEKITVLYVDDSYMLLGSVKRQLESTGEYRVLTTDSLVAASSMLGDADVALLDWDPMGPAMVAACHAAKVPFVIYTGDISQVRGVKSIHGYPCVVRSKPATSMELSACLKSAMELVDEENQP
jgi:DNA-binding NtrC family response regulator